MGDINSFFQNRKNILAFFLVLLVIFMFIHIESSIHRNYAPESVLIKISNPNGLPEENANCKADITSEQVNENDKSLKNLDSIYDFIDSETLVNREGDKGYYLLETDFKDYRGEFEIKIVCYSIGFSGVSYTIINNTNMPCELQGNGKFLIC